MNYVMLEKVICDTIKEEQIKLGYEKETIRLYYPMSSLIHILEEEITDPVRLTEILTAFAEVVEPRLGKIEISHKEERFCILIPPDGAAYVHEHYQDNPFLIALIDTVRQHNCTLEQLLKVFHQYSEQVECEKSKTDEFDYVIYFTENTGDDYRYCFKFEHGHAIYHRFLKQDFQNLYIVEAPEPVDPEKELNYKRLTNLMSAINCMRVTNDKVEMYKQTAKQLTELGGYKDTEELAEECKQLAKQTKKDIKKKLYKRAQKKRQEAKKAEDYKAAAEEYRKISGYKDADALAAECDAMSNKIENKYAARRVLRAAIILLCAVIIIVGANLSVTKYYKAGIWNRLGSYERAAGQYKKLGTYRDSLDKLAENEYAYGLELVDKGAYAKAAKAFTAAGTFKDSLAQGALAEKLLVKNSKAGDIVKLNNVKWRVLEITESKALLMKEDAIPPMPYHTKYEPITWENSSLRKWLNSEYLDQAFTQEERKGILLSSIVNEDNPIYKTDGGNDTEDTVFLLSISEAVKYHELFSKFKSNSWLRTPGNNQSSAAFLSVDGSAMEYGYDVTGENIKVRPVLWMSIE